MSTISKILRRGKAVEEDDDGVERLSRVLEQDPRSLQFVQLAELYRQRGLFNDAIGVCQRGLQFHPTYVTGHVALARAYQLSGQATQAIGTFVRVVALAPQNLIGHLRLGELYEQCGDNEAARRHFVTALRLGAEVPDLMERIKRLGGRSETGETSHADSNGEPTVVASGAKAESEEDTLHLLHAKIVALESYRDRLKQLET